MARTSKPIYQGTSEGSLSGSPAKAWLKAIALTSPIDSNPRRLLADVVEDWSNKHPEQPALISASGNVSYRALADRINRYALWALSVGINPGDRVCLIMPTRSDYIAAWLGISRVGGIVALINTNLVGQSLAHCINIVGADHIIIEHELEHKLEAAASHITGTAQVWRAGGSAEKLRIDDALAKFNDGPPSPAERRDITVSDGALLIFTSGTTGLPKAANVSHGRVLSWSGWFAGLMDAKPGDRLYDCLPLFHSVGGIVAPCSMLFAGASVVLTEKFSASSFWQDIVRFDCTIFQYIGELCRYLLKTPHSEFERRHRLRLACGNGLRGDIWEDFQARFSIPQILEFYAATEGNFSLFNVEGKVGALGKIPPLLAHRFPASIVKVDAEQGVPLRDHRGLCIACAPGEVGEAIGRIGTAKAGGGRFEGYTDARETEKKILRDVFETGDSWYRTGDLMRLDAQGHFHFVDRIGDTFRWKGENVATSEVNDAIRDCAGVIDAVTYSVLVPGADGRAGMGAIVVDDCFEFGAFADHLVSRLPSYAHPLFLRLGRTLDTTETFKLKKQQLMREGFDPALVGEPLYFRDPERDAYRPLDPASFSEIVSGAIRF
ncbi:MAG: long-chain-acyl-CoA synthetase [Bradyrhizobium sp.]